MQVTTNDHLKSSEQLLVEKFMARMNHPMQPLPTTPVMPSLPVRKLRSRMMLEEVLEVIELGFGLEVKYNIAMAAGPDGKFVEVMTFDFEEKSAGDLREVAGNLADSDVVGPLGTAAVCGIAMRPITLAVCGNNLLKFADGHSFRSDGKLQKPANHPKIEPHLGDLLRLQGWEG